MRWETLVPARRHPQPLDILVGIESDFSTGPRRSYKADLLIVTQRLRVNAERFRDYAYHITWFRVVKCHCIPPAARRF